MSVFPAGAASASEPEGLVELAGILEHVTFRNDENGYTVARLQPDSAAPVTVVGHLLGVGQGSNLRLWGGWAEHPRYGRQFKVRTFAVEVPATSDGLVRYLATGPVRGVGPATAERLVAHFGADTLKVLDEDPGRLSEVQGIGRVRAAQIASSWSREHEGRALMLYLQSHGVTAGLAARIHRAYGPEAMAVVQREPYRLARDVRGIGFRTADLMALRLGVPRDSSDRLDAGVVFALQELAGEGHTAPPVPLVIETAAELLGAEVPDAAAALDRLTRAGEVGAVDGRAGLPVLLGAEEAVARRLIEQSTTAVSRLESFAGARWEILLPAVDARLPHALSGSQREAVRAALTNKVAVLTGGPGTGKTTTIRAVLQLAHGEGKTVALAAPTGRAARRLADATGRPAKTIHRLLEFAPFDEEMFQRGPDNPVEADLVVIDEASMVDTLLMHAVMRGLHPDSHLLLVGDSDQLPSVGPGNVLADILSSGRVPSVRLDEVHRQAAGSDIVVNAHRIHRGEVPEFREGSPDFYLFKEENAAQAAQRAVEVATERIPRKFGLDPMRDIQVLAPMHRGPAGVAELNRLLQAALNPVSGGPELRQGDAVIRPGDRVMQTKNDYTRDVFNGDQGIVSRIDTVDGELVVDFDGRDVVYSFADADALSLAYACSVHKSQGSEYPAVVLVLVGAHYIMLQRNLLYTAITRARQLCVVVGSPRALRTAVGNDKPTDRHTLLGRRLSEVVHQ